MGVVVLVGVTVTLAAIVGAFAALGRANTDTAPRTAFTATVDPTDGYPDGQRLTVTHAAGDPLAVADLVLVVTVERVDARVRLSGFPTRRLTGANLDGGDVFDNSYAGVDGALDAAHTDGEWTSGEVAAIRFAQSDLDVRRGDRVRVRVVHRPTNAVLARLTAVAA